MRSPVNEPGPSPTAIDSSDASATPCVRRSSSITAGSISLIFRGGPSVALATIRIPSGSRSSSATESVNVEVSRANSTGGFLPRPLSAAVEPDLGHPPVQHSQLSGRALADVDDPRVGVWTPIVDPHLYRLAGVQSMHPHAGPELERAVRGGHLILVELLAAGGG